MADADASRLQAQLDEARLRTLQLECILEAKEREMTLLRQQFSKDNNDAPHQQSRQPEHAGPSNPLSGSEPCQQAWAGVLKTLQELQAAHLRLLQGSQQQGGSQLQAPASQAPGEQQLGAAPGSAAAAVAPRGQGNTGLGGQGDGNARSSSGGLKTSQPSGPAAGLPAASGGPSIEQASALAGAAQLAGGTGQPAAATRAPAVAIPGVKGFKGSAIEVNVSGVVVHALLVALRQFPDSGLDELIRRTYSNVKERPFLPCCPLCFATLAQMLQMRCWMGAANLEADLPSAFAAALDVAMMTVPGGAASLSGAGFSWRWSAMLKLLGPLPEIFATLPGAALPTPHAPAGSAQAGTGIASHIGCAPHSTGQGAPQQQPGGTALLQQQQQQQPAGHPPAMGNMYDIMRRLAASEQ